MSLNAKRQVRSILHYCQCGHRALYVRPGGGAVAFRRDHPLCPRCWHSALNRERALQARIRHVAQPASPSFRRAA